MTNTADLQTVEGGAQGRLTPSVLVNAIRNHLECSMGEAKAQLDAYMAPRIYREQEAAELRRRIEGQRYYAAQALNALISAHHTPLYSLGDDAALCKRAHELAKKMVELECDTIANLV